jgi:hypothetical protein
MRRAGSGVRRLERLPLSYAKRCAGGQQSRLCSARHKRDYAERVLRVVAVGRTNWEFAGSDEGAARAAALCSLTFSCRRAGVDPEVYVADVLRRVSTTPQADVATLTPRGWKAARAAEAEAAAAAATVESPAT